MTHPRLIALLLLAAAALPLSAGDLDCSRRESGRRKLEWLNPPPRIEDLPAQSVLESAGAFIILDEVYYAGGEKIYSYIAQLHDPAAFEAFGVVEARVPLHWYADIRARVYMPGETPQDMPASELRCSLVRRQNTGELIGRAAAAKHYLLHLPALRPGIIIQYQVHVRPHISEPVDWLHDYSRFINLYLGGQGGLRPDVDPDTDPRLRYPAGQINFIFNLPRGMDYRTAFYPDDGVLLRYEQRVSNPFISKVVRLSGYRPVLPREPLAPSLRRVSPWILTHVATVAGNYYHPELWAPEDWSDWVLRDGAYPLDITAGTLRLAAEACLHTRTELAGLAEARADCVARNFPVGQPEFHAGLTVRLLQAEGYDAGLLYLHEREAPAIDRTFPSLAWFAQLPVIALNNGAGGWQFSGGGGLTDSGSLNYRWQGGEGLLIRGERDWAWLKLPMAHDDENRIKAHIRYELLENLRLTGTMELEFTGAQAVALKPLRRLSPELRDAAIARALDEAAGDGTKISDIDYTDPESSGATLTLKARIITDCVRAGSRIYFSGAPLWFGPRPAQFAASSRMQDIDLRLPSRYLIVTDFPSGLAIPENPAPVTIEGPGFAYHRIWRKLDDGRSQLSETTTLGGLIPVDLYAELARAIHAASAEQQRLIP